MEAETVLTEVDLGKIIWLSPSRFTPSPDQPRQQIDEGHIIEIALSIADLHAKKQGVGGSGFIQPINARLPYGVINSDGTLKQHDFKLFIIGGETRWRAASRLTNDGVVDYRDGGKGRSIHIPDLKIPAVINDLSEEAAYELMYFENAKRQDIHPLDEGRALWKIKQQHGFSYSQLANYVGKNKGYVQNRLDLYQAGQDVQDVARQRPEAMSILRVIKNVTDGEKRGELLGMVLDDQPYETIRKELEQIKAPPARKDPLPRPKTATPTVLASYDYLTSFDVCLNQIAHAKVAADKESKAAFNPDLRRQMRLKMREMENYMNAIRATLDEVAKESR